MEDYAIFVKRGGYNDNINATIPTTTSHTRTPRSMYVCAYPHDVYYINYNRIICVRLFWNINSFPPRLFFDVASFLQR